MRIVNSTPNVLKENLDSAIQEVVSDFKENYHISNHNPDFSRKRVLTMETVINILLSMQGGSLKKGIIRCRSICFCSGICATAG